MLSLAMILGLATAGLAWNYMQQLQTQTRQAVEKTQVKVDEVQVVVARADIPYRTTISDAQVELRTFPTSRHAQAVGSLEEVVGKITKVPISAGEQVLTSKYSTQRAEAGLTFIIPAGKRAVAIAVSEVITSGGLIQPGDLVDVLAVFDAEKMGKDMSTYILQGVEVLAVGQLLPGDSVTQPGTVEQATSGGAASRASRRAYPRAQGRAQGAAAGAVGHRRRYARGGAAPGAGRNAGQAAPGAAPIQDGSTGHAAGGHAGHHPYARCSPRRR